MSGTVNSVKIEGRICREPELRNAGENVLCNFAIVSTRVYKNSGGVKCIEDDFFDIQCWNELAQTASSLTKGQMGN